MKDYTKAVEIIRGYLKHMLPSASIDRGGSQLELRVAIGREVEVIRLAEPNLDDIEAALNGGHPAKYINGQIRDATLRALICLGKGGMAPHVDLSNDLINEDLDWTRQCRLDTEFSQETAAILVSKLMTLRAVADKILQSNLPLPDVAKEREILDSLVSYFDQHQHLNSRGVSTESLRYIKAAAFLWIRELESLKRSERSERAKVQRSIKYFEVVEQFWALTPYNRLQLPPIINDYIAYLGQTESDDSSDVPAPSINIGALLRKVDRRLEERWQGAWEALKSDNPDKVSQAVNSMVEVLDQVIGHVCQGRAFQDVLAERYGGQQDVIVKKRAYIASLKSTLHSVKHETNPQPRWLAEDLIHAAEGIIRTLLRE
jgi:hypothetical protein